MKQIDVSIIIINYNTFEFTKNCIQSIFSIESSLEYEIILVDNASSECDAFVFKSLFPQINLIKSPTNLGFSKGNNLGISAAKGKYILLINSDTILKNDAVSISKSFLETHPDVAVATCRLEYQDGRVQHNCQRFPSPGYITFELFRLQKIFPFGKKILLGSFFDYQKICYPDWVWGTFFMFRKELLEKLPHKKLADDYFMYVEDMQWCMDFRRLGFKIVFLPDAQIVHLMGSSGGAKNQMMEQNMQSFMKRYYPLWKRKLIFFLSFLLTGKHAS